MASEVVPFATHSLNPPELRRLRAAHLTLIEAAVLKQLRRPMVGGFLVGMPQRVFNVGVFLAAHGFTDEPSEGERQFKTSFDDYRAFITFPEAVEAGRLTLLGRRGTAVPPALQVAA